MRAGGWPSEVQGEDGAHAPLRFAPRQAAADPPVSLHVGRRQHLLHRRSRALRDALRCVSCLATQACWPAKLPLFRQRARSVILDDAAPAHRRPDGPPFLAIPAMRFVGYPLIPFTASGGDASPTPCTTSAQLMP